jgi:hypothetical protein
MEIHSNFKLATALLKCGFEAEEAFILAYGEEILGLESVSSEVKDTILKILDEMKLMEDSTGLKERQLGAIIIDLLNMELYKSLKDCLNTNKFQIMGEISS